MVESRTDQDNLLRFLALCGIAAPIVFAILVVVGGFIYTPAPGTVLTEQSQG